MSNAWTVETVSNGGERVTHLYPNDCYYAHLSIYWFATRFCKDAFVLDAGSGAGYGAAYLADHGARHVIGVDVEPEAVAFSRDNFKRPNLQYEVSNLQDLSYLPDKFFDLIFSSNALEHVPNVQNFFREASRLLTDDGRLLIAVPPIVSESEWKENVGNKYHLNIWTPKQWLYMVDEYFEEAQAYWHGFYREGVTIDFNNRPDQCTVKEDEWIFAPIDIQGYYTNPSLTVIFVATKPKAGSETPAKNLPLLFVDESFSRDKS